MEQPVQLTLRQNNSGNDDHHSMQDEVVYKIIENDQVIIIRGNNRYDVLGRKLKP